MISKADVAELLTLMQQFDRFVDVTELSAFAWWELLSPVISDAEVMKQGMLAAYRVETGRVTPAHIIQYAGAEVAESPWVDRNDEVQEAIMRRELAELGTTPEEYRKDAAVRARVNAALDARAIEEADRG